MLTNLRSRLFERPGVVTLTMKHLQSTLSLSTLQAHFGMRLAEVARKFDCCVTLLVIPLQRLTLVLVPDTRGWSETTLPQPGD